MKKRTLFNSQADSKLEVAVNGQKLRIEALEMLASIGVHEHEKAQRQRILLDIDLELSDQMWAQQDELSSIVNYDTIVEDITLIIKKQHFLLQETLAQAIASKIFENQSIIAVRIYCRKPDVFKNCKGIGYELKASRTNS